MTVDLNETIAELARTTPHGLHELEAVASAYPDPDFLRFVVNYWASGMRASVRDLAVIYSASPKPDEWGRRAHADPYCATNCSPGHKHSQCGCTCDHRSADPSPTDPASQLERGINAPTQDQANGDPTA